jgi:HD-GYP domain-containing protein (c-di-GMP phosphodiesterase class II)
MAGESAPGQDEVRTAEVIGAACLATDLSVGLPFEHGLSSTLIAMDLAERLGVDSDTAAQTYYGCLLFYAGCTADADVSAELFTDGALLKHFTPVMFGSPIQTIGGIVGALADGRPGPAGRLRGAAKLPKAVRGHSRHLTAMCEVAEMLTDRLGTPDAVRELFVSLTERWDGKGEPHGIRGTEIPLALRIIHVARDAAFQEFVGGRDHAADVIRTRSGAAFDPAVARCFVDAIADLGTARADSSAESVWAATMEQEPEPRLMLRGDAIDSALSAMGDFGDLVSPYMTGHSAGVAALAAAAGEVRGLSGEEVTHLRRAGSVHDIGRVAVPAGIWLKPDRLSADEWERVRLHAYHTERVLCRSPFLARLSPVATAHHERLDGSGYHRGSRAAELTPAARLLAAADVYQTKIEPRPHRDALSPERAAELLGEEATAGRLDPDSVMAVLTAAGQRVPRMSRPAGLTDREAQVVALLARGMQTKQIARSLGVSVKTADRHVQNAYAKIGVSTRAAAALFAMQNGLVAWGEFPMVAAERLA